METNTATETKKDTGTVTGVFRNKEDAEKAYDSLIKRGYKPEEIILLMSDTTHKAYFDSNHTDDKMKRESGSRAMEKAGVGSAIGGTTGAIIGAIAAIGTTVALPGLGLIIAGPIVAALAGAGAGGIAGGLVGGLVGAGIPKEKATLYETSIKEGGIVVGVVPKTSGERTSISREWNTYGGENIQGE